MRCKKGYKVVNIKTGDEIARDLRLLEAHRLVNNYEESRADLRIMPNAQRVEKKVEK